MKIKERQTTATLEVLHWQVDADTKNKTTCGLFNPALRTLSAFFVHWRVRQYLAGRLEEDEAQAGYRHDRHAIGGEKRAWWR